jgi:PAS domain S-box-containing protein
MTARNRDLVRGYCLSVFAVAVASVLTWLLWPWLERTPTPLFTLAVVFGTWYGGKGPGIAALGLALPVRYYFLHQMQFLPPQPGDSVRILVFLAVSIVVIALVQTIRRQREWLSVSLSSIGDAVITTDREGRPTFLNPVAEKLTGWTNAEAAGQSLAKVFNIINEQTRQPAQNPVGRVLREGQVVGLANHTALICRDGREIPIQDSAAPIKDSAGNTLGVVMVFHDIAEKRRAEDELRASEERFKVIYEQAPVIIEQVSLDGHFMLINPAFCKLLGYSREELLNLSIEQITHPEDRPAEKKLLDQLLSGAIPTYEIEKRYVKKTGEAVWVRIVSSLAHAPSGEHYRISIIEDVTERKQMRDDLLRRSEQLAEANRAKDEFLAVLSHELRTPLTAMLGWVRMLRGGKLDSSQQQHGLDVIERNTKAQAALIEDLLDLSRIISGKLVLELGNVDLKTAVHSSLDAVRPAADAKGIELQAAFSDADPIVRGDANRLRQVIYNLLSNAVKFTPRGGRVSVRVAREESSWSVSVSDTGIGIESRFLPYVFDRFTQADSSTTRKTQGLGLGLAIVRHLVELHGGGVTAESPGPNQGATFLFRLPVAVLLKDSPAAAVPAKAEEDKPTGDGHVPPTLAGLRVLIVEDEPDARELLVLALQRYGARTAAAGSVQEALGLLDEFRPDLLLSDLGMPEQDGYDMIRLLRARSPERCGNIPAVALTAYAKTADRVRALTSGFQAHVPKPVEPDELAAVLSNLMERSESKRLRC